MGTSPSKKLQDDQSLSFQGRENSEESAVVLSGRRKSSSQDDDLDDGSFVFIDKEWSCSVSSAEDVLLIDGYCYSACSNELNEINSAAENSKNTEISIESQTVENSLQEQVDHEQGLDRVEHKSASQEQINQKQGLDRVEHESASQEQINQKQGLDRVKHESASQEQINQKQGSDEVEHESSTRKDSDCIDVVPQPCSAIGEFPEEPQPTTEILLKSSADNFTPPDIISTGKEEWIQIGGCDSTLFDLYDTFSTYGSISALAKTNNDIYVKFSSWAGVANVFDDIRNLKQLHQFHLLVKVEDDELKKYPDRTEIYLDLPNCVIIYLKEHRELSKGINIITMTANDNICFNAPKIQQILDYIKKNVSKGFQLCRVFPFGCHILGTCDRFAPLEIFVDVGDMYAGCHKQTIEDQIAISKEIRKLISDDALWYSHEESPIGTFYHKTIGLKCILNFNNGFGDRCTRLLGVFMDYDDRFRVLYLILDIWSRQCSLQGVTNGLNSYIVAVLLVFYLQVLPVPLLPPLQRIRSGRPVVIKGWDCTFLEDANLLPRHDCTTDLHSLLRGFFVFYGSYDWRRIVCPVLGQSIDRNLFSSPPLPFPEDPIFGNYLRALAEKVPNTSHFDISTSMCIQDFFNLSENIAKEVSSDTLLRFQSLCRQSHKMIYSAESKMSFRSHMLHHKSLPPAPCHMPSILRKDRLTKNFSRRVRFGSVSDFSTSSFSSNADRYNRSDHGMYCTCERFSRTNCCKEDQENWQPHPRKQSTFCRANYNFNEDTRYQSNGTNNARGRKIEKNHSYSRSYRGRVFWHNNAKHVNNKVK